MKELMIALVSESKIPIYEQICNHIKREIQQGRLEAGLRLPSSRAMAQNLQVSRSTVNLAYDQLVSEGYLEALPCRGYFVCALDGIYYEERQQKKQEKKKTIKRAEEKYRCDFALNGIAKDGFPHSQWKKISGKVLSEAKDELFAPGDPCGEFALREAVAGYLYHARSVTCDPEQIIVGAGNDYLLMLLSAILGKDKVIAMEDPTYISAYYDFKHLGHRVVMVEQDEQGMHVDSLERSDASVAYVMPSHQFPMGTVMPIKRRMELLKWVNEGERYLIEDDYDSEFRYRGKPIPALRGVDMMDKVIYLGTFSKSIAPAIRISYMVLPKELMEKYRQMTPMFSVTVSKVDQKVLEIFLKEGNYERHLNKMRSIYKNKHDIMLKYLKEMTDICTVSGEHAGVHLVLKLQNGLIETEAVRLAKNAGIKVYGLSDYIVSGERKEIFDDTILLGYATVEPEDIEKYLTVLKNIWQRN